MRNRFPMLSALLRRTLFCGLACLGLVSCDESQIQQPKPPPPGDTTAPAVVEVIPGSGATGVQGGTTVRAAFSERLQASTLTTSTFTVSNSAPIPGTVTVTDSIGTFTPSSPMSPNTTYTARITTGVKDLAGNALASEYVWNFTTGPPADDVPPTIVDVSPTNGSVGVVVSTTVRATFSELMNASSFDSGTFLLSGPSGAVAGAVALGGSVASFTPSSPLQFNTTYTARVTTDAEDLAGNRLASDFIFTFTTAPPPDETRPEVDSVQPLATETDVDPGTTVKATFTEAVNPATVNASTFRLAAGASPVTGTVTLSDFTATFTPSAPLAPGTVYTATITTGVEDLAGNSLATNFVWSFTTSEPPDVVAPTVSSTTPPSGATNVSTGTAVTATFSEPVAPASVSGSTLQVSGAGVGPVSGGVTLSGATATFTPSSELVPSTLYTARITTGVEDLAGNNLASEFVWTFTTVAAPDQTPPTVTGVVPPNASTNVSHGTVVQATFSEPVAPATVSGTTIRLSSAAGNVPGTVSLSGQTATLTPSSPLAANTLYTARVTTGVEDLAGNNLASEFVWTFTTAPPPDLTPPTVTSTDPTSGTTGVSTSAVVEATFSEPMSAASLTPSTFTLTGGSGAVSGSVALVGQTATFTPSGPLAASTTYTARIHTGAEDLAGNNLASDFVWTFTTADPPDETPPTVISVTPNSGATGVDVDANVTATFSESVLPASVTSATFLLEGGTGSVSGSVTLSGVIATLNPAAPLSYATTYTARVTTGVEDLAGNSLAQDFVWTFTTEPNPDATRPTIVSTVPADGATDVSTGGNVEATFSEPVSAASVNASTFLLTGGAGAVAGAVSLTGQTAVFNPSAPLSAGTIYTARVTTNVEDLAGNNLAQDFIWTFTTAPPPDTTPPTVTSVTPSSGATDVDVDASVRATFSEPVAPLSTSTFLLTGGAGAVSGIVGMNSQTAVFIPSSPLLGGTTYTARVTTGVEDLAGNNLAQDFVWTFTTAAAPDTTRPAVSSVTPLQGTTGVDPATNVTATFSEAVAASTVNAGTVTLEGAGVGPVTGAVTLSGATATLDPSTPLAFGTTYTARITTGVEDLSGNALASDFTWTFTTQEPPDTTAPSVTSVLPADGATLVSRTTNISATFSESIDPASVTASTFLVNDGQAVPGVFTVSGATVTFNPDVTLAPDTLHTVTLTTGIQDLAGNPLDSAFVWTFSTTHLAPTANAGPDQEVFVGSTVTLDGTGSFDPEGRPLTYEWTQVRGEDVTGGTDVLTGPTPSFTAPLLPDLIEFQLRVSDGDFTSGPNRVRIEVVPLPLTGSRE